MKICTSTAHPVLVREISVLVHHLPQKGQFSMTELLRLLWSIVLKPIRIPALLENLLLQISDVITIGNHVDIRLVYF